MQQQDTQFSALSSKQSKRATSFHGQVSNQYRSKTSTKINGKSKRPSRPRAKKTGIINLPTTKLSTKGATAHILPNLQNALLISLGKFSDDNCITVLEDQKINIYKNLTHQKKNCIMQSISNRKIKYYQALEISRMVLEV